MHACGLEPPSGKRSHGQCENTRVGSESGNPREAVVVSQGTGSVGASVGRRNKVGRCEVGVFAKNDGKSMHGGIKCGVEVLEKTSVSSETMIIKGSVERTRHSW